MNEDPYNLARFVAAQQPVYAQALAELQAGRKRGHWIWFILPQLAGLGRSAMARYYGISGLAEARAYLQHPLLGARLRACCQALLALEGRSAHQVLGSPDDLKLRSCATLFACVDNQEDALFQRILARFYAGEPDPLTLAQLQCLAWRS